MDNSSSLLTLTLTLFIIMDPLGNISSFLNLMQGVPAKRQFYVLLREMLVALAAMFLFFFLGEFLFRFLQISPIAVWLASGVILFLTAIKILFPTTDSLRHHLPEGEPFLTPLAIPLIAGPSLLATIMLYAHLETCRPMMINSILLAWMGAVTLLLIAPWLQRTLSQNGLVACEKLTGMLLVMLAIQRFLEGVRLFLAAHG
jgi:small neutral amino acid transporter SnatA (MarC family)